MEIKNKVQDLKIRKYKTRQINEFCIKKGLNNKTIPICIDEEIILVDDKEIRMTRSGASIEHEKWNGSLKYAF